MIRHHTAGPDHNLAAGTPYLIILFGPRLLFYQYFLRYLFKSEFSILNSQFSILKTIVSPEFVFNK